MIDNIFTSEIYNDLRKFMKSTSYLIITYTIIGFAFGLLSITLISNKDIFNSKWERTWRMYITKNKTMTETVFRLENDSLVGSYLIFDNVNNRFLTTKMKGVIENENLYSGTYSQYDDSKLIITGKFIFGLNEDGNKFTGSYWAFNVLKNAYYKKSDYWFGEVIK